MRRSMTFLTGMIIGGVLLYGALSYHILRADDGFHLIPKTSDRLAATYVDIRKFTVRPRQPCGHCRRDDPRGQARLDEGYCGRRSAERHRPFLG